MGGAHPPCRPATPTARWRPDPALWFLTDIFALPRWVPFANVFSVGDLLIATGIAVVIVIAMRAERVARREADARADAGASGPGAPRNLPPTAGPGQYLSGDPSGGRWAYVPIEECGSFSFETVVQGKPVVRRGRKARDLRREDRPVAEVKSASRQARRSRS